MTDNAPNPPIDGATADYPSAEVANVLDQYLEDIQNGRACSRAELLEKHPDIQESLKDYLGSIEMVAGLGVGGDLLVKQLGDFEIVKQIGCGAMGVVYLANQLSLKRQVALKVLRYTVVGEQATKRFEREAELVATLRHPNIVPIYSTGTNKLVRISLPCVWLTAKALRSGAPKKAFNATQNRSLPGGLKSPEHWLMLTNKASFIATSNPRIC